MAGIFDWSENLLQFCGAFQFIKAINKMEWAIHLENKSLLFQQSSDSDLSDDEDITKSVNSASKKPTSTNKIKATRKNGKGTNYSPLSRSKIVELLLKISSDETHESLEWLKESFGDAIEDYEVDNNEGIPLVPVMDYAEAAIGNVEFQKLLKAFGVCPPCEGQEVYWRIPTSLTPAILTGYCELLEKAMNNSLEAEISNDQPSPTPQVESSDDEDIFDKLRSMTKPDVRTNSPEVAESTETNQQNETEVADMEFTVSEFTIDDEKSEPPTKRRVLTLEDSDDEDMNPLVIEDEAEATNLNERRKNRNLLDSGSEEEGPKRPRSESDSDLPTNKRSRIIESDED